MACPDPSTRLPSATLTLWRVHSALGCAGVLVVAGLATWYWRGVDWVGPVALAVGTVAVVATVVDLTWLLQRRFSSYRYELGPAGLHLVQGVMVSRRLGLSADRILYVEVRQGPVGRLLGLATVQVGTLGSVHEVGPIAVAEATTIAGRHLDRRTADAQG